LIRVGIIGFGMGGRVFHGPLVSSVEGLEFSAVVERNSNNASARYPHIKTYRSTEEMLADDSIDLVVVTTPSGTHFEVARQVLEAGKHLVVDKPLCTASADIARLIKLGFLAKHPVASALIALGGVVLLVLLVRLFWNRGTKLREQVKTGGAILGHPRRFLIGVALPELGSYLARLGIVAVFMAAYSIPVSFHSVVSVSASNSISNVVSVTPGGAGVNQAFNVAVLDSTTSSANAAAYSLAQQLIISAWDVVFAIVLVSWVFGWSGGKRLVKESYAEAEAKEHDLKAQRHARRTARRKRWQARGKPRS